MQLHFDIEHRSIEFSRLQHDINLFLSLLYLFKIYQKISLTIQPDFSIDKSTVVNQI